MKGTRPEIREEHDYLLAKLLRGIKIAISEGAKTAEDAKIAFPPYNSYSFK